MPPCGDTIRAGRALRIFLAVASPDRGSRAPHISRLGRPGLTKDECRLLRAVAAVQADDEKLLDSCIYRIALDRKQRACLAEAVRALAKVLAARGYVLPALPVPSIPAPALDETDVAWPG